MTRLVAALAVASTALTPSTAGAWETQRLTQRAYGDGDVALAGNSRGDAAVVYVQDGRLMLAAARAGGRFGTPHAIPGSRRGYSPRVAMDEAGRALVVWSYFDNSDPPGPQIRDDGCCYGARLTVRSPSRHFRRVQALTPRGGGAAPGAIAIAGGRVAVAFTSGRGAVVRSAARGKRLGKGLVLARSAIPLGVAALVTGPVVTLARYDAQGGVSLLERRVKRGRRGPLRSVAPHLPGGAAVAIATNARGDQALAWHPYYDISPPPVYAGTRTRGGRFHPRKIADEGPVFPPLVTIAPSGAAAVAWSPIGGTVLVANRRPHRRFAHARKLADGGGARAYVGSIQLGVDRSGRAVLGWTLQIPGELKHGFAAFRSTGGRRLGLTDLGLANNFGSAYDLSTQSPAAFDDHGRARLAWRVGGVVNVGRARFP